MSDHNRPAYRYYLAYTHGTPESSAFGWVDLSLNQPIRTGADIHRVISHLEDLYGLTNVTVLNFQHFDTREDHQP